MFLFSVLPKYEETIDLNGYENYYSRVPNGREYLIIIVGSSKNTLSFSTSFLHKLNLIFLINLRIESNMVKIYTGNVTENIIYAEINRMIG